jgi:uncharacterized protein (TIGR04552 family)
MTDSQSFAPERSSAPSQSDAPSLHRGAFSVSESLRRAPPDPAELSLDQISLQDANELRLLLRGESVIDWHRLDVETHADARRLLSLNAFDWDDPRDRERIATMRSFAADYVQRILGFHVDDEVAHAAPFIDLLLMASGKLGNRKQQRSACVLLKVLHILHHLDARELRTRLPLADAELFASVEDSVLQIFDALRSAGAPVVEFQWSRKTRDSLLTKMLVKRETSAARVFDRLRFRLIVKRQEDLLPTLRTMLRKLIPFNYVVPGQTANNLIDPGILDMVGPSRVATNEGRGVDANEFSGANFRVVNFIADLPVRVDDMVPPEQLTRETGHVVFVLAEFQLIDIATAKRNEEGESSHDAYKNRQHARVRERMLRIPQDTKPDKQVERDRQAADAAQAKAQRVDELLGRVVQADET